MTGPEPTDLDTLDDDGLLKDEVADPAAGAQRPALLQPGALAVAAVVVALASFLTSDSLINALVGRSSGMAGVDLYLAQRIAAGHLAVAAVAALLGLAAGYLWDDEDPLWVRSAAWGAVLVAVVSALLQAVVLVLALSAPAAATAVTG